MKETTNRARFEHACLQRLALVVAGTAVALIAMAGCASGESADGKLPDAFSSEHAATTSTGNSNSNTINGGWAAINDGWIYYGIEEGLFRVPEEGGEAESLLAGQGQDGHCIRNINIVGDWIYCRNFTDGWGAEYRVKTDGTQHQEVVWSGTLHVTESGPYAWERLGTSSIHSLSDDLKKESLIYSGDIVSDHTMNICGDYAYFCASVDGQDGIYRIKTDGGELELFREGRTDYLIADGDWLYFEGYRDNGIFRIGLDGSALEQVSAEAGGPISGLRAVSDGWVYYADPEGYLCRLHPNDGARQVICSDPGKDVNVVGDWVYFTRADDDGVSEGICCRVRTDGSDLQELGRASNELTYYREENVMEEGVAYDIVDVPGLLDGDFTAISGTYAPVGTECYGIEFSTVTIDDKGAVSGSAGVTAYAAAAPTSVARSEDGSYQCVVGEVDGMHQFYTVYPIGVRDGSLDTLRVRIAHHCVGGGAIYALYEQIEQWA